MTKHNCESDLPERKQVLMLCKVTHCAGRVLTMHDKPAHVKLCHDDLQAEETIVIKTIMLKK